jgi:hypothetical protein
VTVNDRIDINPHVMLGKAVMLERVSDPGTYHAFQHLSPTPRGVPSVSGGSCAR